MVVCKNSLNDQAQQVLSSCVFVTFVINEGMDHMHSSFMCTRGQHTAVLPLSCCLGYRLWKFTFETVVPEVRALKQAA